jgi:hypothetical protein
VILWLVACTREKPAPADSGVAYEEVACETCAGDCLLTSANALTAQHVEGDLVYEQEPPMGGDHNPCWAPWGVHEAEVAAENWVHNLEHGGIVFLTNCTGDSCEADWAALVAWVETLPEGRAILSPYGAAPQPYTAVSWGHRLELGCFDLPALQAFYEARGGQGPEDVTSGPSSACM